MVSFNNQSISFKLKEKTKLKQWIKSITEKEKHKLGTINYIFCTDDELLEINIKHLNHNTLTDIITFDYREEKTINSNQEKRISKLPPKKKWPSSIASCNWQRWRRYLAGTGTPDSCARVDRKRSLAASPG